MIWIHPDNIESGGKCGLRNIKIRNSPSEWDEFFYAFAFLIGQALILMLQIFPYLSIMDDGILPYLSIMDDGIFPYSSIMDDGIFPYLSIMDDGSRISSLKWGNLLTVVTESFSYGPSC